MFLKKNNRPENIVIIVKNTDLKIDTKFTNLDVGQSSNGSLYQAQKGLSKQAL